MDPRSRGQNRNLSKKESNKNLKIDLLPKRQKKKKKAHSKGLWEQRPGSNPRGSCASTDSRTNLKDKPVRITCV